jgi:phosphoadenosine phosphosulfate reductase
MTEPSSEALERLAGSVRGELAAAVHTHGRVVYASSLGAEAVVLTDIIFRHVPEIEIFTIDTGRLPQETHELMERIERHYGRRLRLVHPAASDLESLTLSQSVNGFYHSRDARLACCRVRKLEPFRRAIAGYGAWVTGVRREQSMARARMTPLEWDSEHGLYKLNPLLDWTHAEVWQYIRRHRLPYNALHDAHFPSIGCAPCTRAVRPGDTSRSGRWWWEHPESRECGLQAAPQTQGRPQGPRGLEGVPGALITALKA